MPHLQYQFLCSSGLLLLIFLFLILSFYFWSLQSYKILDVAAISPLHKRSSIFHLLHCSSFLLMWRFLSVFVANGAVGQDPEVCRTITLLLAPALFMPSESSSFTCSLFSGKYFFIFMSILADELRLHSGACIPQVNPYSALFRPLCLPAVLLCNSYLLYSALLSFFFSSCTQRVQ